jgi:hypothetical protein
LTSKSKRNLINVLKESFWQEALVNELSSYVFSPLREGDIALRRGSGSGLAPILVVTAEESSLSVERLEHEYALKAELDADWEQGSQQLQGEALELELESLLRGRFPRDLIEPVPKGEFGGDVLHRVLGASGQHCGTLLWESKRTKAWSDGWLAKLRDDQRIAKAEIALIVSTVLPKGVAAFDLIDNVWVSEPRFAVPLAVALRQSLIDIAGSRLAQEGQQTKMEMVYQYLTGPRFRHRIGAIVEKFTDMQADLDRERKTMMRMWAKREEQLIGVLDSTAGLYGDLQGIAGRAMPEIASLDVLMIEDAAPSA